jgi:hypothetical protein
MKYVYENSKKYCSKECRQQYGRPTNVKNPANHITFTCQNCGKEKTRPKGYGANKYCSNDCAKRHTKVRRHVVVREGDIVMDSSWEALVWGLCRFRKLPIDRFDRENGVEWREGQWYAPDFILPTAGIALEVKGQQDSEDHLKWAAYREQHGLLAVLGEVELDALRLAAGSSVSLLARLREIATQPVTGG